MSPLLGKASSIFHTGWVLVLTLVPKNLAQPFEHPKSISGQAFMLLVLCIDHALERNIVQPCDGWLSPNWTIMSPIISPLPWRDTQEVPCIDVVEVIESVGVQVLLGWLRGAGHHEDLT
jgi:hypothetical protein